MPTEAFTVEIAEFLYASPKYVASVIDWRPKAGTSGNTYRFHASVVTDEGLVLDLSGTWTQTSRHGDTRWGFSLNYLGHPVRSYDMGKRHANPNGYPNVKGPHKHKYWSSRIPRLAYKPDPPISETDPNQALLDFLEEGNIKLQGPYQTFSFPV